MFPITVTHNINNAKQLAAFQAYATSHDPMMLAEKPATPKTESPKAEAPKQEAKASPKEEAKAPSTGTTSESQKSDAPSDTGASGKTWTLAECKQMTTDAVRAKKREEVLALLKEFGVAQTALLPEDAVQPFGEKLAAILNGAA